MKRLTILKLKSYSEYYEYLCDEDKGKAEIVAMISRITTHKTDFFREKHHFHYLKSHVFPELLHKANMTGKSTIRIWSAGCSTGEEPYSIAIAASEFFENIANIQVKILASDIDENVINEAKIGIYSEDEVEVIPKMLIFKYFEKGANLNKGNFKIKDKLKQLILFKKINLADVIFPIKPNVDIIFCRNVLIYFGKNTVKNLIHKFYDLLSDDGHLFLGHSENIFEYKEKFIPIGNTIYKKSV